MTARLEQEHYLLGDVSQLTGLSKQKILNLVERDEMIVPKKDAKFGAKDAYRFTSRDIQNIESYMSYRANGEKNRRAVMSVIIDERLRRWQEGVG